MVIILLQERHLTLTSLSSSLSNFLEPQFGQIGQARNFFILMLRWFCVTF